MRMGILIRGRREALGFWGTGCCVLGGFGVGVWESMHTQGYNEIWNG
jgi:hypothetical protein